MAYLATGVSIVEAALNNWAIKSKAVDYTVLSTDDVVLCTAALTLTLFAANTNQDGVTYQRPVLILNTGSGVVTVNRAGSDTFADGTVSKTVAPGAALLIVPDGVSKWAMLGGSPTVVGQSFRGLAVRTHPDSDKAANKVLVTSLAETVMNTGTRYSGLTQAQINGLVADITSSGAGGLDTGSRAASTWYGVYLIGKGDGNNANLSLMLHREKNYGLDQSQTTNNGDLKLRFTSASTWDAQQFTAGVAGSLEVVDMLLEKLGTPTGNVWLELYSDSANLPNVSLATSDKIDGSKIGTSYQTIRFAFRSPSTLVATTKYWIVLKSDTTISGTNYYQAADNVGGSGFVNWNGSAWVTSSNAMWFKAYVTQNTAALTLPATYTEYCQLGWVYNNGSNTLVAFEQVERVARNISGQLTVSVNPGLTIPVLIDISTFVPPVSCLFSYYSANQNAFSYAQVAPVPDGYGISPGVLSSQGASYVRHESSGIYYLGEPVEANYQAIYAVTSATTDTLYAVGFRW